MAALLRYATPLPAFITLTDNSVIRSEIAIMVFQIHLLPPLIFDITHERTLVTLLSAFKSRHGSTSDRSISHEWDTGNIGPVER